MKVLLIGFSKIKYMPYIHFYFRQLKSSNSDIHVLYWRRDDKPDQTLDGVTTHVFNCYMEDLIPLRKKLRSFLKFRRFALKLLKKNTFDRIIVLQSTPGVTLSDILIKKYKGKYILDYRDITYENFYIYRKIVEKLVRNAFATFVSSDAFRKYLPKIENIYPSHNLLMDSLGHRRTQKTRCNHPVRIGFWGHIRREDINKVIVDKLANDQRFELHYYGREQKTGRNLRKYCKEKQIKNVFFHGEYSPEERYSFVECTDILHNIHGNRTIEKNAIGNKYYDGIVFYIPQICNEDSLTGDEAVKNGVGCTCSPYREDFAEEIYKYYKTLDWEDFEKRCDRTLDKVVREYNAGTAVIDRFIEREERCYENQPWAHLTPCD